MKKILVYTFVIVVCLVSCKSKPVANHPSIDYADTTYWYSYGDQSHEGDVFLCVAGG